MDAWKYSSFNSIPRNLRPCFKEQYPSEPTPEKGEKTVSPGFVHSSRARSMTSNCRGQICLVSLSFRACSTFNTRVCLISNQTGEAYLCQTSRGKTFEIDPSTLLRLFCPFPSKGKSSLVCVTGMICAS